MPKQFVDNRVPALQREFPRTHADVFAEASSEAAFDRLENSNVHVKEVGHAVLNISEGKNFDSAHQQEPTNVISLDSRRKN